MKRKSKHTIGPVEFIDRVIKRDEKGQPFSLATYQRRVLEMALRRDPLGELVYRAVVLSKPRKSGKTFMAACLALCWALTNPHTEIIITTNDLEQSVSRIFKTMTALIEQKTCPGRIQIHEKKSLLEQFCNAPTSFCIPPNLKIGLPAASDLTASRLPL